MTLHLSGAPHRLEPVSGEHQNQRDGDDPKHRELAPEQQKTTRRISELAKGSLPRIHADLPSSVLSNITGAAGFADYNKKLLDAIAPAFKVSNLGLKVIDTKGLLGTRSGPSTFAAAQSKLLDSIMPGFLTCELGGAQSALGQLGAAQSALTAQLMKNVDLGVSKQMAAIVTQFTASQSKAWESIAASASGIIRSFYPPNLRDIDGITLSDIKAVAFDEGIPMYLVPRQETAALLLGADDLAARLGMLEERSGLIVEDCRAALAECESELMAPYVAKADEAAAAFEAGYPSAAQALTSSILEGLIWDYFGRDKKRFVPNRWGKTTPEAYDELGAHEFLAFAPVWQAFQQYDLTKGDLIPATFSRHATAHTVSEKQYTRANALQGLMLACSLVAHVDAVGIAAVAA